MPSEPPPRSLTPGGSAIVAATVRATVCPVFVTVKVTMPVPPRSSAPTGLMLASSTAGLGATRRRGTGAGRGPAAWAATGTTGAATTGAGGFGRGAGACGAGTTTGTECRAAIAA
jgi:hypothetical protein